MARMSLRKEIEEARRTGNYLLVKQVDETYSNREYNDASNAMSSSVNTRTNDVTNAKTFG